MAYRLLLADDSITIQKVVELVLAEEDFEIKSVSNGEDALNLMDSFQPHVVLADIEMPKVNGYQLCERIKQDPKTSAIPVILLAGAFEPIDEELAAKVGADDSVIKPFESQELISKLNAALTLSAAGEMPAEEEIAFAETEESLEFVEDEAEIFEPEAAEPTGTGEDLWAMEDISGTQEEWTEEAVLEEEDAVLPEEAFEFPGEPVAMRPEVRETAAMGAASVRSFDEVAMPSKEEVLSLIQKTLDAKVSEMLSTIDLREALLNSLMPAIKDSVEKILWEITPDLVEKMLKEVLKSSVSSLTAEVEKVIWETVPDLAGTMISSEIEKIKSEI